MKKSGFWKADWFPGVLVMVLAPEAVNGDLLRSLERKAYDFGVNAASQTPSDGIAVIASEKRSVDNSGCWSWPRDVHARMSEMLSGTGACIICSDAMAQHLGKTSISIALWQS